jgi:4'-phosphopantetheinyl transferase
VVNDEEQYSIWPVDRELPLGWSAVGKTGSGGDCLDYIEEVWTDMRPKSVRDRHQDQLLPHSPDRPPLESLFRRGTVDNEARLHQPPEAHETDPCARRPQVREANESVHFWHPPTTDISLKGRTVHVWRARLDPPAALLDEFVRSLSSDELAKADRFCFARDRNRFVAGRGILRAILARYTGRKPADVVFHYSRYGKPRLREEPANAIRFNLAHSGEIALFAFGRSRKIGVDLEELRPLADLETIARCFFSATENKALHSLPTELRVEAFLTCWTRKEAYIKGLGVGLSFPLKSFDVSLRPGEPVHFLGMRGRSAKAAGWVLCELHPGPTHVGAMAVEGSEYRLRGWNWEPT